MTAWFAATDLRGGEGGDRASSTRRRWRTSSYVPTGFFHGYQAWRRNVTGVVQGAVAVLLGRDEDLIG